ncbi:response regulator transcription factor [Paenibacillus silviterrae]|uniref:response regulator transcription factor n=1 Tax=Paenibacillus silviterrae TaxID=3242194 RepID=UPI0025427C2E|nr:response regulator [Paenibacillus chinjuensis]
MKRILIVDDEQHIREGIAAKIEQCEEAAYLISGEAASGTQALDWLASHFADICITDIRMPVMDGLELIRCIKEKYPWMLCIIVSSYDDFHYAKQALQLGVKDYILKPIDREMLQESLAGVAMTIQQNRLDRAFQILVEKMHPSQGLMNRWKDLLETRQFSNYPLLVVDTLQMFEDWVHTDYYLFDALTAKWIEMVAKELNLEMPGQEELRSGDWGDTELTLRHDSARFYFRLGAVMRLEKGMLSLIEVLKNSYQHENVKIIRQVKHYIDEHYAEKINLEELADLIPISRSYLAVLFKQSTGQTVWNYLVEVRMKNAKLLLLDQKLRIYEVAGKVGYENSEHFSKLFKEYYGVSPKDYRRMVDLHVE